MFTRGCSAMVLIGDSFDRFDAMFRWMFISFKQQAETNASNYRSGCTEIQVRCGTNGCVGENPISKRFHLAPVFPRIRTLHEPLFLGCRAFTSRRLCGRCERTLFRFHLGSPDRSSGNATCSALATPVTIAGHATPAPAARYRTG